MARYRSRSGPLRRQQHGQLQFRRRRWNPPPHHSHSRRTRRPHIRWKLSWAVRGNRWWKTHSAASRQNQFQGICTCLRPVQQTIYRFGPGPVYLRYHIRQTRAETDSPRRPFQRQRSNSARICLGRCTVDDHPALAAPTKPHRRAPVDNTDGDRRPGSQHHRPWRQAISR